MRIDLTITELDMGGAERCCAELAMFLHSRGHSVRVIAIGSRPHAPKDNLAISLQNSGVKTHFLNAKRIWSLPVIAWKMRRLVKMDKPQILQSFLWHANVVTALIAPQLGIPLVGGVRVAEPRSSRYWIGGWAARRMSKVVCVSHKVADWCMQNEHVDPSKIVVIPNGVALGRDSNEDGTKSSSDFLPDGARVLLFIGRLEYQKGIDILIEHGHELLSKLPQHHLVIIGDGTWMHQVSERTQKSIHRERIHVLGQRNDVRRWMRRAELLVLPTRYEGMPNVVLEAMAEKLAVVTTAVEGNEELLDGELKAQMVPTHAWDLFFEKIVELSENGSLRDRLARANFQRVESHYELEHQLIKYESLYQSVLTSFQNSR